MFISHQIVTLETVSLSSNFRYSISHKLAQHYRAQCAQWPLASMLRGYNNLHLQCKSPLHITHLYSGQTVHRFIC